MVAGTLNQEFGWSYDTWWVVAALAAAVTFVSKLRKDLLPGQELDGGAHGRLRQLGRDYLAGRTGS